MNLTLKLQLGFVSSSKRDTSRRETLTNGALRTCAPQISRGTRSAISSPVLAVGPTLSEWLNGPIPDPYGPVRALANRSARQAKAADLLTSGICGPRGIGSSASKGLTLSLVSKLQNRLIGSILYRQTWKQKTTPSGRVLWAHIARPSLTCDRDSTGWPRLPTTAAVDGKGSGALRERDPNLRDWFRRHYMLRRPPVHISCAMMGYPEQWVSCGVLAMQSVRPSRRNSSVRT